MSGDSERTSNMKICGIDPSTTCSGVAILENGKLAAHEIFDMKKNRDAFNRIEIMIFELGDFIQKHKPDVVYVEDPNGKSVKIAKMISNVIGGIMYACYSVGCDFQVVTASQWRSALGIKLVKDGKRLEREGLKAEDIAWVHNMYGIKCGDDEADAICIANAGLLLYKSELFE